MPCRALQSYRLYRYHHAELSGCTLTSTSAALKIGTEGTGDFENVIVDNCIITNSNRGISIQVRDGGHAKNVSFSNIIIGTRRFADCWWGTAEPIVLTTHERNEGVPSGRISNIRFTNITCDGENGVFLSGCEGNLSNADTPVSVCPSAYRESRFRIRRQQ